MSVYTRPLSLNEFQVSDLFFAFAGYYIDAKSTTCVKDYHDALLAEAAEEFAALADADVIDLIQDYKSRV